MASGCLTREYYPNAEKGNLNQVRQCAACFRSRLIFIKLKNLCASNFNRQKLEQAFHLEISVYSRSDKHLISKMEKPKVANFKLELFGESVLQFFFVSFFFSKLSVWLFLRRVQFSFHLIPHFTPQAVGGGFLPVLVQWTAFTLPLHPVSSPLLSKVRVSFPLCRVGFFSVSSFSSFPSLRGFTLPSPKPG